MGEIEFPHESIVEEEREHLEGDSHFDKDYDEDGAITQKVIDKVFGNKSEETDEAERLVEANIKPTETNVEPMDVEIEGEKGVTDEEEWIPKKDELVDIFLN